MFSVLLLLELDVCADFIAAFSIVSCVRKATETGWLGILLA